MEKNANLHRDVGGGAPCSVIAREMGDMQTAELVKGATDRCKNSDPSTLTTLLSSSACATLSASTASDCSCIKTSEVVSDMYDSAITETQPSGGPLEPGEQLSNGTGHPLPLAPANDDGATSKFINNKMDSGLTSAVEGTTALDTDVTIGSLNRASQQQTKISPPTHLCPSKTSLSEVTPGVLVSNCRVASEGPRSRSDPSSVGESRSFDSLDSFSNLNSCPSSDLNSEGLEDRALAIALQSEDYGADGPKVPCAKDRGAGQSMYHIKWIKWKDENTPIITQNENGPCPLLAIMNVLLLAWKVKMPPMMEIITAEQLMEYLGDYILDAKPKEISEAQRLNYEQNMSDAMAVLHKLQTGLDVNVKFTGVRVFEYTPECIVFDLLDIPLYHGWLVDPQMDDIVKAVGNCSYNQLVEKIISCKQSDSSELAGEGFVAEQFLNSTATQLTYHGLCELTSTVQEEELCVFFRNNHFSTMTKFKGQLYLLVTDQGFLTEEKVVWESLHNVDGDGNFCDSEFRLRPPSDPETVYRGQQDQIDQDYLMALSLQQEQQGQDLQWESIPEGMSDLELAKKLQEEEDRRASQFYQEQEQAAAAEGQGQQQPAEGSMGAGAREAAAGAAGAGTAAGAAGAGTAAGGAGGAAGGASATPSQGKQPSPGERKPKKEPKDKDKCVIL
ncbi:ubiquitin carboxyl-terminal hydrolase MINDY-2-like [Megalops cyprinoides]|uniref:ubiquitin carboxyl-terminal hydrolase MINDY-2-like n=1 Tax=Megalops cyprinoides TaxID=118141 RepID=UPI001863A37C|nr:ubiquitin carboxyl-terminal hydrolase MINDY-2-like [Megalops cyprinoides]